MKNIRKATGFVAKTIFLCAVIISSSTVAEVFLTAQLSAQTSTQPAMFGIFGAYNLTIHTADFRALPNVPNCCPQFQSGSGSGLTAGLLYQIPVEQLWQFSARATYMSYGGKLTAQENETLAGNIPGVFEHRVVASIASVGVELLANYRLSNSFTLSGGLRAGLVTTKSFSQEEVIIQPEGVGLFSNGRSIRNDTAGTLPRATAIQGGIIVAAGYELPLNRKKTMFLEPELSFLYGLVPVVDGVEWSVHALRFGASLKFAPAPPLPQRFEQRQIIDTVQQTVPTVAQKFQSGKPEVTRQTTETAEEIVTLETVRRTDTIFIAAAVLPKKLAADITAVGVEADGKEMPLMRIRAEEFASTVMHPLLNYIFFDEGGFVIPARYAAMTPDETSAFNLPSLVGINTLEVYHQLLNIVAFRMRKNPSAKLTITGTTSDEEKEKSTPDLAAARAKAVQEYLTEIWGINRKRLIIKVRTLPENPSNTAETDGNAENRRVELTSSVTEILDPIIIDDTLRSVSPPLIKLRPSIIAEAGLKQWKLHAQAGQSTLQTSFSGENSIEPEYTWNIAEGAEKSSFKFPSEVTSNAEAIGVTLNATDIGGQRIQKEISLPIEYITITKKRERMSDDKQIERFHLILFDYDKSTLSRENQRIITTIRSRLRPESTISIAGYTDRLGDEEYNQKLSESRAHATAKAIGFPNAAAIGYGKTVQLFDNNTPEGRFYSRTVVITTETPVK